MSGTFVWLAYGLTYGAVVAYAWWLAARLRRHRTRGR